jgi:hypothetical protein
MIHCSNKTCISRCSRSTSKLLRIKSSPNIARKTHQLQINVQTTNLFHSQISSDHQTLNSNLSLSLSLSLSRRVFRLLPRSISRSPRSRSFAQSRARSPARSRARSLALSLSRAEISSAVPSAKSLLFIKFTFTGGK